MTDSYIVTADTLTKGHLKKRSPRVSFAIPTLNSERTLERCLRSIVDQDYPYFEIVIVDGFSKDATVEIAKKYADQIFYCKGTLGQARQMSIQKSSGEIVALFDADIIIPHKKWSRNVVEKFNYSEKVSTVWPLTIPPPNSSFFSRCLINFSWLIIKDRIKKGRGLFGGGHSLFRKKYIEEVRGFDEKIHRGEDFCLAKKLKERGYQVIFHQDPLYHDTTTSLREFTKKEVLTAETFAVSSFKLMNLALRDAVYEQYILGLKGMMKGLFIDKDLSWTLFPLLIVVRTVVYGLAFAISYMHSKNKMKTKNELFLSESPKSQLSAYKIKKTEMRSWKGSSELDFLPLSLGEKYTNEQDYAILGRSIQSFDLHNKVIVNVGGGHGKEAEFLIKKGAKNVIIADIAIKQLLSAKIRKERHELNDLELVQADVDHLPFKKRTFDLGYVCMALHHFPDHQKSIAEICRVVKDGVILDIIASQITRILNFIGFFSREWCGIEPHKLCENDVKIILRQKNIESNIIYLFAPPYTITKNKWSLRFIKFISNVLNSMMHHFANQKIGHLFENVGIIIGRRVSDI